MNWKIWQYIFFKLPGVHDMFCIMANIAMLQMWFPDVYKLLNIIVNKLDSAVSSDTYKLRKVCY